MARMDLWERSDAMAALDDAYRATAAAGCVALIAGEAGIGKSFVVHAFAARQGSRARVLWGACDPLLTPRASGPLHDIATQAGGLLAERLAGGAAQADLFAALVAVLAGPRQRSRRVVVVEDAHWADEATHDLIVFLGRRIDRLPALLVVTYRDDEVGPEHPLRVTLSALPRHVVRVVPIAPLSKACVAEQAARVGREPDELFEMTGGNPLLVTELLGAQGRAVPSTVRDLILARLRGLSRPAREVAWLVSVMPTSADAVALGGLAEQVDECVAGGVLVPHGNGLSYRHDVLRQAVEDSLSPARRAALHAHALSLLESVAGVDPARLVHHARHAGDAEALLRYGIVAATGAAALGAHREAAAHFRAVRAYLSRLDPVERASLLEVYAEQAYLAGVSEEGLEVRQAALVERKRLGEIIRVGENYRWISRLHWWSGRGAEAREAAAKAVEVLEVHGASHELAMAYSTRSQLHMLAHELPEAIDWGKRAQSLADRLGDLGTSLHALTNISAARLYTGEAGAEEALRSVHRSASAAGLHEHAVRALVVVVATSVQTFATGAAAAAVDEVLEYATACDLDGYVQYILGLRAGIRVEQCEWDGALADAERALSRPGRIGIAVLDALVAKGRILAARGEREALATLDAAAEHAYGTEELPRIGPVAAARAEYFLLAGVPDRGIDELRRALSLALSKGHRWMAGELAYRLWQATGTAEAPGDWPEPYRLLAQGDWGQAAQIWAGRGREYARIEALTHGAAAAAAEALQKLADLGAVGTQRRLRADLRRRGMTRVPRGPRPSTAVNAAGLTSRQLEILRLLANGMSNVDIAAELTLSRKTVEHHVSAVIAKLGVASRGQAIVAAHRLNLVS
jgi:DNA-binding CsgD family transcriptional regulator/tetratricopeptide (TPR) repeat protein